MTEPLPLESHYDVTLLTDVALSPDGERAAFVATEYDDGDDESHSSLFTVPTDGSEDPYRLARSSDASSPKWSPDGSKLGFIAAREEDLELTVERSDDENEDESADDTDDDADGDEDETGTGGEGPNPQLWVFDLERGGDARQVTDRDEGVVDFDWGPDGERVVIASRDPTDEQAEYLRERRDEDGPVEVDRLQHKFDGKGWLDDVTTYLFVVDLDTREERRLDDAYARGAGGVMGGPEPRWSPDGERIAFHSYRGTDPDDTYVQNVYTIAPDGDDLTRVTDGDLAAERLAWNGDGSKLAFASRTPDNWYVPTELYVADVEDGNYWSVSASLDRTLAWGGPPQWIDDETLVALIGDEARTRLCRFDTTEDDPERVFERQADDESVLGLDVEADAVTALVTDPKEGRDLHAMDVEDLDAGPGDEDPRRRLTTTNDDLLETYDQPDVHRLTFESDDGTEVEALAFAPPDFDPDDPDPRPLVLDIHGGPMTYDQPGWTFNDGVFTTRDYVVLKVNYRGSTSYGRGFSERLKGKWNTVEVEDLLAGVDEVVDRGWADPDRLFCTGFSQGGINTAYVLTRDDPFAAAAAEHGIYDARSAFGTDDSHNWWEADFGLPWENPEAYDAASSITDADEIDTPLLLTAGEEDWRCPVTQAEQLYVSVKKQGVPARLVVYTGEHHNVGEPDRAIHRLEELIEWFAEHDPERETDDAE
jgi:dipeptidyl aminopeptidase/acylaminoacyl peptidase